MNISTSDQSFIVESIQKTNDLLRMIAAAKLSIDDTMMKQNVAVKVAGMGESVDTLA